MLDLIPSFHMWFVLGLTVWAIYSFVSEKWAIEVTCVALLTSLLLFGQFFPLLDANGHNKLDAYALLSGFANPSLVAVIALLVMGQGIIQTDALHAVSKFFITENRVRAWASLFFIFAFVLVMSGFMNNTPLVVIAIPVVQGLAQAVGLSESRVMMPLSFAAILGGMTTLVGSSTNLLVSSAMVELGYQAIGFFDFVVPGVILASIGFVYLLLVLPHLMPDRRSLASQLTENEKEFIAELDVTKDSQLVGMECVSGRFPELPDLNVRLIQRSGHLILPPFEGYTIEQGDILIVAAKRSALADILAQYPGFLLSEDEAEIMEIKRSEKVEKIDHTKDEEDLQEPKKELEEKQVAETRILAEVMITPGSRMIDMSLEQVGFHRQFGTIVLGIQRRARVVRRRLGRIRLEPGDVLLIAGSHGSIENLRHNQDLIVLSGSKTVIPLTKKAPVAGAIFLAVISLAATGILSIPVAAITGSVAMLATGCLNVRQATRAIDRKIFLLVGSMLALGVAFQATKGAQFIADIILGLPFVDSSPLVLAAVLFMLVAISTNILSNNACAILFTPIALNMGLNMGVDPLIFAYTVIFAANCSFASPIGYKTNLLVMGPGHYRFRDFLKAGVPLVILLWISYIFLAYHYYGLPLTIS